MFAFLGKNAKLKPCGETSASIAQISGRLFVLYTTVALLSRMMSWMTFLQRWVTTSTCPLEKVQLRPRLT